MPNYKVRGVLIDVRAIIQKSNISFIVSIILDVPE